MPLLRYRRLIAVLAVGVVSSVLVALFVVPVPRPFELREVWIGDFEPSCGNLRPPAGDQVRFSWSAPSSVEFVVVDCATDLLVSASNGTGGGGAFVASGGWYDLGASCGPTLSTCIEANVTGTLSGPYLMP